MQDILEFILQFCTIIILFFKYIVNEILISDFLVLDTLNKLGYKAKINTHTTSYIN